MLWNVIARDWVDADGWVETAMQIMAPQDQSLVVIHDLPTGAMAHLPRFIDLVREAGGEFQQAFHPDFLPLTRGKVTGDLDACVTEPAAA